MEIRDEDLSVRPCTECRGKRLVWAPMESVPGGRHEIDCPTCSGRGVVLTETGAKLAEFVQRITNLRLG
jgi:hypothetical protein